MNWNNCMPVKAQIRIIRAQCTHEDFVTFQPRTNLYWQCLDCGKVGKGEMSEIREVSRFKVVCDKCSFVSRVFDKYEAAERCLAHHYQHKHCEPPHGGPVEGVKFVWKRRDCDLYLDNVSGSGNVDPYHAAMFATQDEADQFMADSRCTVDDWQLERI